MRNRSVKKLVLLVLVSGLLISLLTGCDKNTDPSSVSFQDAISNGKPTLAEFGRGVCIPCKAMKPILEDLSREYKGELNVVIVEVDANMDITRQYEIMMIPTQIFFDSDGKEVFRHVGFFAKEDIIIQLGEMGID